MRNLRHIPRLPPLLRVVSIGGLLLPLAALVLLLLDFLSRLPSDSAFNRVVAMALNLTMLGVACSFAVGPYRTRLRRPDGGPVPRDAWPSQLLRALLLAAALPLFALALAVVITPAYQPQYTNVFLLTLLAAGVSYGANLWLFGRHQAAVQQERSPGLAALAALSLVGWLALYGLDWYARAYPVPCGGDGLCLGLMGPGLFAVGAGALLGFAAWLWATVRAVRRYDALSALSIGLLLPVALGNAVRVNNHAVGLAHVGSWGLFSVVSATLLATSVTRRQSVRRVIAVAGLVLVVALLVASNLVDYGCLACHHHTVTLRSHGTLPTGRGANSTGMVRHGITYVESGLLYSITLPGCDGRNPKNHQTLVRKVGCNWTHRATAACSSCPVRLRRSICRA